VGGGGKKKTRWLVFPSPPQVPRGCKMPENWVKICQLAAKPPWEWKSGGGGNKQKKKWTGGQKGGGRVATGGEDRGGGGGNWGWKLKKSFNPIPNRGGERKGEVSNGHTTKKGNKGTFGGVLRFQKKQVGGGEKKMWGAMGGLPSGKIVGVRNGESWGGNCTGSRGEQGGNTEGCADTRF